MEHTKRKRERGRKREGGREGGREQERERGNVERERDEGLFGQRLDKDGER